MLNSLSDQTVRFTRRSLLLSSATAAGLLAMPGAGRTSFALAAQTPTAGSGVFFDPALVHDVTATFDQAAYDAMIDIYAETGDKEWISATVSIDGQSFEEVGMRLKGNSSLMSLRGDFGRPGDGNAFNAQPAIMTIDAEGTPVAGAIEGQFAVMGGPGGDISADEPAGLPWLVRLDRNIDGQNFNGLYEFVIRSNNSETALNEALALELLTEAGLASQAAAYIRFAANDNGPRLRLAIENPDDVWLEAHFSEDGTLFKSEAEGDWSYKDDDLDAYMVAFDLEAGGGDDDAENYAPLISFLDFLNNSDDATFIADLPARLDIDQFAVYMSMMDLIENGDAIDGPGNNSYLYYDPASSSFTVVPWDMNLTFGGGGMGGVGTRRGPGGGFGPGQGGGMGSGDGPSLSINGTPIAIGELPTDAGGPVQITANQQGGPGGMGGMNNPLVRRWEADADFAALQSETEDRLRTELFQSGMASEILARWVGVLDTHATDLIDQTTIDSESQGLQEQIDAA